MTAGQVLPLIGLILNIFGWLIIVRSLLSWFPNARGNQVVEMIYQVTDPVLIPLQRIVPRIGMIDISPMIAVLVLFALAGVLGSPGF